MQRTSNAGCITPSPKDTTTSTSKAMAEAGGGVGCTHMKRAPGEVGCSAVGSSFSLTVKTQGSTIRLRPTGHHHAHAGALEARSANCIFPIPFAAQLQLSSNDGEAF